MMQGSKTVLQNILRIMGLSSEIYSVISYLNNLIQYISSSQGTSKPKLWEYVGVVLVWVGISKNQHVPPPLEIGLASHEQSKLSTQRTAEETIR